MSVKSSNQNLPTHCRCGAYLTAAQAGLSRLRADHAEAACKDCVTRELTIARTTIGANEEEGRLLNTLDDLAKVACDHKFQDSTRCIKCGWLPTYFRVVGWFSFNPLDTSRQPFSLETRIETNSERHAYDCGEKLLHQIKAPGAQLLNWYVEPMVADGK